MALPVENKRILFRETTDCLGVVRGRDKLTARLESSPKSQHKGSNLVKCQIVVGFIPETKYRAISIVGGKHQGAYHETFFAVGQILERKVHASLIVGKLDDQASRISADRRVLDVLQVGHHLLEILVDR